MNSAQQLAEWDARALLDLASLLVLAKPVGDDAIRERRRGELARRQAEDEVSAPPAVAVTRPGDLWLLDEHRLLCGDSIDSDAIARLVGDERGVLVATDPPYGVDFGVANHNPTAKDWGQIVGDQRQGTALREWLAGVIRVWMPYASADAAWYVWSASLSEGHRFYEAMLDAGLHVQSQIVWTKNVFAMGQADYQWKHEPAWYGFLKGSGHRWFGGRDQTTVWQVARDANAEYEHPTQKPVELFRRPVLNHTRPGEVCLEPFSGSGSQLIACEQLGRRCYAMELDPKYCDVTVRRWERFTGRKAERVKGK